MTAEQKQLMIQVAREEGYTEEQIKKMLEGTELIVKQNEP